MPDSQPAKSARSAKIHSSTSAMHLWFRMYQKPLSKMLKDREITGSTLRTYLGLLSVMDFDNEVCASQKAIAEIVGNKQPNVSKAMRILQEKGIITRTRTKLDMPVYKINEDYVLKGDIKPLKAVKK